MNAQRPNVSPQIKTPAPLSCTVTAAKNQNSSWKVGKLWQNIVIRAIRDIGSKRTGPRAIVYIYIYIDLKYMLVTIDSLLIRPTTPSPGPAKSRPSHDPAVNKFWTNVFRIHFR